MKPLLAALLAGLLTAAPALAQWAPVGPSQTTVRDTAFDGTTHYLATTHGLFARAAGAEAWTDLSDGLPEKRIETMALGDAGLYAFLGADGFWFRDGTTWVQRSAAGGGDALTAEGGTLYTLRDEKVWTSTDGGATWAETAGQPDAGNVNNEPMRLAASGDYLFAGMVLGTWRSADRGATWSKTDAAASQNLFVDETTGRVYTANATGVFVSADLGSSWTQLPAPPGPLVAQFAAKGEVFVVLSTNGRTSSVWISRDGGQTYAPVAFGNAYPNKTDNWVGADAGGLYVNYSLLTYRSEDGAAWSGFSQGLAATNPVVAMAFGAGRMYALTSDFALHAAPGDDPEFAALCYPRSPDDVRVCLSQAAGVAATQRSAFVNALTSFRSDDGGPFLPISPGLFVPATTDGTTLYGLATDGVYRADATADPLAWTKIYATTLSNADLRGLRATVAASGTLIAASTSSGTFVSADGGATWASDPQIRNASLAILNGRLWAGDRYSDDGGTTFQTATGMPTSPALVAVGKVLVAGGRSGVFLSRDNGSTWQDVTGNFPAAQEASWAANALFHDDTYLYASLAYNEGSGGDQGAGLWRRDLAALAVATASEPASSAVAPTLTTYPQPFRETLAVQVEATGSVTLRLYDVLGREVRPAQTVQTVGAQTLHLATADLAAGVYLLHLTTHEGTTVTRQLVRLR